MALQMKKEVANELYQTVHEQFKGIAFDRREIEEVVRKYGPSFRDKTHDLFSKLENLHIPVVIFSAGLGDVIVEQLRQKNVQFNNVNLISNYLNFNGSLLNGLQNHENLIHEFNKQHHLSQYINSTILKSRKNVILMGDHTGDAAIVEELQNTGCTLKIGYFYNQVTFYAFLNQTIIVTSKKYN